MCILFAVKVIRLPHEVIAGTKRGERAVRLFADSYLPPVERFHQPLFADTVYLVFQ